VCEICGSQDVNNSCLISELPMLLLVYLHREDENSNVAPDLFVQVMNLCESNPNTNLRNSYGKSLIVISLNLNISHDSF